MILSADAIYKLNRRNLSKMKWQIRMKKDNDTNFFMQATRAGGRKSPLELIYSLMAASR